MKRPIYFILILLGLNYALNDLGHWVGYFLRSTYHESYRQLVLNYEGIGPLFKDIFRHRSEFVDIPYLMYNYWLPTVLALSALTAFIFRAKILTQIAPGKARDVSCAILNFLEMPSQVAFSVFLGLAFYCLNGFLQDLHHSYQIGVNEVLAKELNSYSGKRADDLAKQLALPPKKVADNRDLIEAPDLKETVCAFYSQPRLSKIFSISYPDFIFHIFFPDNKKLKEIETLIGKLPTNLNLTFDDSFVNSFKMDLSKDTYTRNEVLSILRQIESNKKLQLDLENTKKIAEGQKSFLKVSADYKLSYHDNENAPVPLGQIKLECSKNSVNLTVFQELESIRPIFE